MTNFNRGSEWRKWDLQVQTIIDDGYISIDNYINDLRINDPENLEKLIAKIGSEDLLKKYDSKNYYFTDGIDDKKTRAKNYAKVFLNYIDIFNENIGAIGITDHNYYDEYLLDALFNESKNTITKVIPGVEVNVGGIHTLIFFGSIPYGKDTYSDGIKTFLSKININNPKENGVLTVSHKTNKELINIVREIGGVIIYAHCNSSNGLFQERTKTDRTFLADIFNEQNVNILQSKNKESADATTNYIKSNIKFTSNFNFTLCSDSRCLKDILTSDNIGNFTWIKADPTFEGLKQIIYEPEERVKIQVNKPEEKTGYQAIDKIIIKDCEDIEDSEIVFNQNLNTIIGGRSTGKSILLGAIAKKLKLEHTPDFETDYDNYIQSISDKIEIIWKDLTENNDREVEYFKQSYIYDLSKNRVKLNNIIEKILRQKGKEEKDNSKELDNYNKFIFDNSKAISSCISDLFQILSDITKTKQNLLDLGDKSGVEKEIEKLNEELKRNSTIQITDEEKLEYEQLKKKLEDLFNNKNSNNNDFENIEKLKFNSFLKETIDYELIAITDEGRKEVIKTFYIKLKEEFNDKWSLKIDEINKKISSDNLEIQKLIKEIIENSIYIKVNKAFTESVQLQEIEKKLKMQKEKLIQIESIIKKIESLDKQKTELIKNIKDLYNKYQTESNIIVSKLSDKVDGLEIKSIIRINEKKYKENLENSLNNIRSENKSALFSTSDKIFEVFDNLIEGNLSFKGGFNAESLSKKIMTENLYEIHYELIYEGDTFGKMSDGKKAFVVLKLLLDFSDKECPILIDQPEDDLDNRSICKELVKYLKKKKKQRQIIVATHNPNVVVTADAEEIIVANQNGIGSPNDNFKKFQYISGSLENTKILDNEILKTSILKSQGIREHVCDIVEGGELAFEQRKKKYNF